MSFQLPFTKIYHSNLRKAENGENSGVKGLIAATSGNAFRKFKNQVYLFSIPQFSVEGDNVDICFFHLINESKHIALK